METTVATQTPNNNQTAVNPPKSLFQSITGGNGQAGTGSAGNTPPNASGNGSGSAPQNGQTSVPGPMGSTVSVEDALKGIKHTEIPAFSATGTPGAAGTGSVTPLGAGQNVALGGMVQGSWAVDIMDAVLPAGLVALCYMMDVKLRKSELQLTQKEKDVISPIMQKCLDSILLNFNSPWSALAWTMGAIYGGKLMERGVVAFVDKKAEKKEAEALRAKMEAVNSTEAKSNIANQSANDILNGNVPVPGRDPWTEEEVKALAKDKKISRDAAIKRLKKKYGIAA